MMIPTSISPPPRYGVQQFKANMLSLYIWGEATRKK